MSTSPEAQLQTAVIELARLRHLLVAHFRPAMTARGRWVTPVAADGTGFPDLVIVGPAGVMYRELKSVRGRLSVEQRMWLDRLTAAGADAALWRPCDLASGRIDAELGALTRAGAA